MARRQTSSNGAGETRENLLRLAARIFSAQGYSGTTMRSIAQQAGIETASIYYHFPSKEDLVDEVMEIGATAIIQHMTERVEALGDGATAEERFRAAVLGQMAGMVKHGEYTLASSSLIEQLPEKVRERQSKRRESYQKLWAGLLEDLRAEGRLRGDVDLHLARMFILGSVQSIRYWFNPRKGSLEKVAEQLCDLFFEGVGQRG